MLLVVLLVLAAELGGPASATNGCGLTYADKADKVEEKPGLAVMVGGPGGICRLEPEDNSSAWNLHAEHKYPEQIRPESVLGGLNYDAASGSLLYWARPANVDHSRLYRVRLNDSQWEPVLEQPDDFRDMAYDWAARNLYIIMGSRGLMVAVSAESGWSPAVVVRRERAQLTSLALHPNRGCLFFVETSYFYGLQNKIFRAGLDGSNATELERRAGADARYYISDVLVDVFAERLYWSLPGLGRIEHAALDGRGLRSIRGVRVHSGQLELASRALAADRHYLYYRAAEANCVRRLDKASGARDEQFELANRPAAPITEIVALARGSQRVDKGHPCAGRARGGCAKFCFAVPTATSRLDRVCGCSFDDVLAEDGVSCLKRAQPPAA